MADQSEKYLTTLVLLAYMRKTTLQRRGTVR